MLNTCSPSMTLFRESVKSFGSGPLVEEVGHWEWPLKFILDPCSYAALCILSTCLLTWDMTLSHELSPP